MSILVYRGSDLYFRQLLKHCEHICINLKEHGRIRSFVKRTRICPFTQ